MGNLNMDVNEKALLLSISGNVEQIKETVSEMKADLLKMETRLQTVNDDVIKNEMEIKFLDRRAIDNYKNLKTDIDNVSQKLIVSCDAQDKKSKRDIQLEVGNLKVWILVSLTTGISAITVILIREFVK